MLEELYKQIIKLSQENYDRDYNSLKNENCSGGSPETQKSYDDGFVDGMQLVYDYLIAVKSLPNHKPFEIIEKVLESDNEIIKVINEEKLKGVK